MLYNIGHIWVIVNLFFDRRLLIANKIIVGMNVAAMIFLLEKTASSFLRSDRLGVSKALTICSQVFIKTLLSLKLHFIF